MISVIIPALNEEQPIAGVVRECLAAGIAGEVIVVDNGSADRTAERARQAGARVVSEPAPGYGRACAAGVQAALGEILVFLDGDGADCPNEMAALVEPVRAGTHDFVIGSRARGKREPGSMNAAQLFAGRLAGVLLWLRYRVRYSDMGPFRAIRRGTLLSLKMTEQTYGWNLEMQMKAAQARLRILEIPTGHRCRTGGESKVSGNLSAGCRAAWRIMGVFCRLAREPRAPSSRP